MSAYTEFFLNSKSSIVQLDCLEISHPNFTQTWRVVRNAVSGVTVTHEDGSSNDYIYYPLKLSLSGPRDDLDHILTVQLGDLGEIITNELDAIRAAGGFNVFPRVKYRTYRSDVLTVPLYGPVILEIRTFTLTPDGAAFEAKAPSLNVNKTGERYSIARFPMLSGLL